MFGLSMTVIDNGYSELWISRTDDGRLRMIERFRWKSPEGTGVNILEELPLDSPLRQE